MIKLYTTKSCPLCEKVKRLIESQRLNVEVVEAQENDILKFREMNIRSFPILRISEKNYLTGKEVGEYIAINVEELKKKKK